MSALDTIKQAIAETPATETGRTLSDILGEWHALAWHLDVTEGYEAFADRLLTDAARRAAALPITDEMVEAGARTLYDRNDGERWQDYIPDARACLEAARGSAMGEQP